MFGSMAPLLTEIHAAGIYQTRPTSSRRGPEEARVAGACKLIDRRGREPIDRARRAHKISRMFCDSRGSFR